VISSPSTSNNHKQYATSNEWKFHCENSNPGTATVGTSLGTIYPSEHYDIDSTVSWFYSTVSNLPDQGGNTYTVTLECPPGSPPLCTGPVSLSFSPNPAWAGNYQVNSTVSGLSNCNGKRVMVRLEQPGMTLGWTACSCTISGVSCSCNNVAPYATYSGQIFNFKAYLDANNNYNYFDPADLNASASLTVNCTNPGARCTYPEGCCYTGGVSYVCSSGTCQRSSGGGCPTLFVYDGKDYVKERKSSIHSQPGIDTVDDIALTTKPVVVNGNYLLQLKETTLPEHSYIDAVRLFIIDSEGKKEAELVSAKHSKYGDVTSALAKSDDVRTDTQVFDNIELKFKAPELKGEANFIFEIEGYNPAVNILGRGVSILGQVGRWYPVKLDIADLVDPIMNFFKGIFGIKG